MAEWRKSKIETLQESPRVPAEPSHRFTAVIHRCPETQLYLAYVPGFPGAYSQAESLDELSANLRDVIELLLENGGIRINSEFVGVQTVAVTIRCDQISKTPSQIS